MVVIIKKKQFIAELKRYKRSDALQTKAVQYNAEMQNKNLEGKDLTL